MTYKVCVPIYQVSLSEVTVTVTNVQCLSAVLLSLLSQQKQVQGGVITTILLTSKDKNLQYRSPASQENWIWEHELQTLDFS